MVTVFLAEGFEEIEAITPVDILRRGGVSVQVCSITEDLTVTGAHGIPFVCDTTLSRLKGEEKMLVLPGGMPGTLHLKNCARLRFYLQEHHRRGGFLAAICAAPTVFGSLGFLKDKTATCYPGMEGELRCKTVSDAPVVVDGNVITSRGPGTAHSFGFRLLSLIRGEEAASELAKAMCFEGEER